MSKALHMLLACQFGHFLLSCRRNALPWSPHERVVLQRSEERLPHGQAGSRLWRSVSLTLLAHPSSRAVKWMNWPCFTLQLWNHEEVLGREVWEKARVLPLGSQRGEHADWQLQKGTWCWDVAGLVFNHSEDKKNNNVFFNISQAILLFCIQYLNYEVVYLFYKLIIIICNNCHSPVSPS